jgi:GNAT superfamily N-acetyltransferase
MLQAREADAAESVKQFTSSWELIIKDLPGADFSDDAGLSFRWADHTFPFWNAIFLSEPVKDANVLKRRLSRATSYMRKKRRSGLVWIFEEYLDKSARDKLPEILQEEMLEFALPATGMAGEIFPLQAPAHPVLRIARVVNEPMLRDYEEINCQAYEMPIEWGHGALDPTLWIDKSYSYLGYENGRAVTAASAIINEGCLFLALVATRPEARKKGYAETVVRMALQRAHEVTGLKRTTLHATDAGHPVYKRIGYYDTAKIMAYKLSK